MFWSAFHTGQTDNNPTSVGDCAYGLDNMAAAHKRTEDHDFDHGLTSFYPASENVAD